MRRDAPPRPHGSAPHRSSTNRSVPAAPAAARRRSRRAAAAPSGRRCSPAAPPAAARTGGADVAAAPSPAPGPAATCCMAVGAQAHALGRAGGSGGEGDLGGARRQRRRRPGSRSSTRACRRDASGTQPVPAASASAAAGSSSAVHAAAPQRMADLLAVKNSGSGTCTTPAWWPPDRPHPGQRVVQQGGQHAHALQPAAKSGAGHELGRGSHARRHRPAQAQRQQWRALIAPTPHGAPAAAAPAADVRPAPLDRCS